MTLDRLLSPPAPGSRGAPLEGLVSLAGQYQLHAHRIYRRCLALSGGDRDWAKDVTQDVFLRLHERGGSIERPGAVGSWLLTTAERLCIDRLRRERTSWGRIRSALTAAPPPAVPPPDQEGIEALIARLRLAMGELPARQQVAVCMKYVEGRKQKEIAERLSCSEGSVSRLLSRALDRLRARWESEDPSPSSCPDRRAAGSTPPDQGITPVDGASW